MKKIALAVLVILCFVGCDRYPYYSIDTKLVIPDSLVVEYREFIRGSHKPKYTKHVADRLFGRIEPCLCIQITRNHESCNYCVSKSEMTKKQRMIFDSLYNE